MRRLGWFGAALLLLGGCADGAGGTQAVGDVPPLSSATAGSPAPAPAPGAFQPAPAPAGSPTGVGTPTDPVAPPPPPTGVAGAPAEPVPDPSDPGLVTEPPPPTDPVAPPPSSVATNSDPVIPPVTADCPAFRDGTINFMGLGGIQMVAGPKAASATAPMVFYWHGTGSFSGEFVGMAGAVHQGVVAEGGVLISFQGSTGGDFLSGTSVFGRGDLDLVDQFVACGVQNHNIDPRRIYTTGCSAGGLFATNMAALRSNYVAAAAPNSGGMSFPQQFQNAFTPALMTVHGAPGRDVVIIDFSTTSATADRAFSDRGGFVINCNHGGGHCGGGGLAPSIWEFFKAHPYGVDPYPWTSGLPAGFHDSCVIF